MTPGRFAAILSWGSSLRDTMPRNHHNKWSYSALVSQLMLSFSLCHISHTTFACAHDSNKYFTDTVREVTNRNIASGCSIPIQASDSGNLIYSSTDVAGIGPNPDASISLSSGYMPYPKEITFKF